MTTNNELLRDWGLTPAQLAARRERERLERGDFSDPLGHLPQANRQQTRGIQGHGPHYSLGEAIMQAEALEEAAKNPNPAPIKQARQSHYPERKARIEYATALDAQRAAEEAERKKAGL
jgi:hypothetical protein